jgi:hypothetical protein
LLRIDAGGNLTQAPAVSKTVVMATWRLSVQHPVHQGVMSWARDQSTIGIGAIDCT